MDRLREMQTAMKTLIDELNRMPEGANATALEILKEKLPESAVLQNPDMMQEIWPIFRKSARNAGLRPDQSAYRGELRFGWEVPFVLRLEELSRHPEKKCPRCGKEAVIPYIYTFPMPEDIAAAERGEALIMGKSLDRFPPAFLCRECGLQFGKPAFFDMPINVNREFHRVVPHFLYEETDGTEVLSTVEIRWTGRAYRVRVCQSDEWPDPTQTYPDPDQVYFLPDHSVVWFLSESAIEQFIRELYRKTRIDAWKRSYANPSIMSGERTRIEIGRRKYTFDNEWPPMWPEMMSMIYAWFRGAGFQTPILYIANEKTENEKTENEKA